MQGFNFFEHHTWQPFKSMGFTHSFWSINTDTIIYTWIALGAIILFSLIGRWGLNHPDSIVGYSAETYVRTFMRMVTQSLNRFHYGGCVFITTLFTFIFTSNILIVFPFMEEPTKDLNTTVALALISFLYVQKEGIKAHGVKEYIAEFFKPFFVFFPLEVLGRFATIISLSFRLFGNIFGGSIISSMWQRAIAGSLIGQLAGLLLGINLIITLFFGLFEGLIQAFVFATLSLTYLSMSIAQEEHE